MAKFSCTLLLLHIGEQVNRLQESLKATYSQVPWPAIKGFRNLIAHDYVGIDRLVVFDTIVQQLPTFKQDIAHIIRTEMQLGAFDKADYELSKQSSYYRHIEFDKIV